MNKELRPLEAFNGICCNTNQNYPDFQKQRKIVETALKVFQFAKDGGNVDLDALKKAKNYEEYMNIRDRMCSWITKEEYELLKEVLL